MEIWKDIPEYEGLYQASTFGVVRRYSRSRIMPNGGVRIYPAGEKVQSIAWDGYHNLTLHKNGETKKRPVHVWIAMTFIPNPLNLKQVNHRDANKANNNIENLEWVTVRENNTHRCSRLKKTSDYVGVHLRPNGVWAAQIVIGKKKVHLGYHSTEIQAANAYLAALSESKQANRYAVV